MVAWFQQILKRQWIALFSLTVTMVILCGDLPPGLVRPTGRGPVLAPLAKVNMIIHLPFCSLVNVPFLLRREEGMTSSFLTFRTGRIRCFLYFFFCRSL